MTQGGGTASFRGTVSEASGEIYIKGNFQFEIPSESSKAWIKGTWTAKK